MDTPRRGDKVSWNYGKGKAEGTIVEVHTDDVKRKVQGATVKRKGSADEPALVIKQDRKRIIKSASEVTKQ
ncbi:hypervirulence associated TUDOR domain-containing protein [Spirosoma gilvum]